MKLLEYQNENTDLLLFVTSEMEEDLEKNLEFFDTNYNERVIYFHKWIEKLHAGGLNYLESIVDFCDKHDVEYEKAAKLISPALKQSIYEEALTLNQLKKLDNDQRIEGLF